MRNHGWQPPYHPLQVVVIAVFSSLTFAFYVFFIPFMGSKVIEYHIIAVFSPLAIVVFVLYIRCAALDPADPGVIFSRTCEESWNSRKTQSVEDVSFDSQTGEATRLERPMREYGVDKRLTESTHRSRVNKGNPRVIIEGRCIAYQCCRLAIQSFCYGKTRQRPMAQEDLLYCSLCKVQISKLSKHCRACDKCVEGFDHHCRWINNCIGKRNYRTFLGLMVTSLLLLTMQWSIGIFVVARGLVNRKELKDNILSKLGSTFSWIPFIVLVSICTIVALVATFPLGQLFFFHVILLNKGISTYDYIVAMRELEEREFLEGDVDSPQSFITGSGLSLSTQGGRLQMKQERTLVQNPIHQGAVSTTARHQTMNDFEVGAKAAGILQDPVKKNSHFVKISPWKLARLDAEEASKAASRARERSKIIRPIIAEKSIDTETDSTIGSSSRSLEEIVPISSSRTSQRQLPELTHSFFKDQFHLAKVSNEPIQVVPMDVMKHGEYCVQAISPLQMEARCGVPLNVLDSGAESSISSNVAGMQTRGVYSEIDLTPPCQISHVSSTLLKASHPGSQSLWQPSSTSDGYEASGGDSADDEPSHRLGHTWTKSICNISMKVNKEPTHKITHTLNELNPASSSMNIRTFSAIQKSTEESEAASEFMKSKSEENPSKNLEAISLRCMDGPFRIDEESTSSPSRHNSPARNSDFSHVGKTELSTSTKIRGVTRTSPVSSVLEEGFLSADSRPTSSRSIQSLA